MDSREAYEYYLDPGHRQPAGPGQKRRAPRLTSNVPVRFRPEVIETVRQVAHAEGITVSAWIRRAVQRALDRPAGLIPGSGRAGTPHVLPSSLSLGSGRTLVACQHMSVGNVVSASCGICGPMRAA